jgi:DAACS family dicarboxylate/amino acid:cation (Na+ or H+) symporter
MRLHTRMAIGLAVGIGAGLLAHETASGSPALEGFLRWVAQPVGQIFLRLLFMLVVPLIFSALALGVAGMGDLRGLGRIGVRTLAYTVVVSAIAVAIGLGFVAALRPGDGLSDEARQRLLARAADRAADVGQAVSGATPGPELLVSLVPRNPVKAAADGDFLGWMVFSLAVGIGLAAVRTPAAARFQEALQGLYDVTMWLIGKVIAVAPVGVAALLFTITAEVGLEVVAQLGRYVATVVLALLLHQVVVYSAAVRLLGGMSPFVFFRGVQEAMLTAFSTASSNATLPTAIRVADASLRLPPEVSRFVLTVGSTTNQNGTALFEGVTVLFLAQVYGVPLSWADQALVVGVCVLAGIGTAGIPAGSLPVIAFMLQQVGIPVEGIGLILGVDRFLDMCRTTLNVTGDLAAAVVVSRGHHAHAPPPV